MTTDVDKFLDGLYGEAMSLVSANGAIATTLDGDITKSLDTVLAHSDSAKGVCTVVLTSVVYKLLHPEQDIRNHQASIPGGYGARPFDGKHITPFLKRHDFPAMAESGWLTRSLEHKVPYNEQYTGAITPRSLKKAFLASIAAIEHSGRCEEIVSYLLQGLIVRRDSQQIQIAKPRNLSIAKIAELLQRHFMGKYKSRGASRLPVLALYALYQSLMQKVDSYKGKALLPLESHTAADAQSGHLGDIDVVNADGTAFEAVEVKLGIHVSHDIVVNAKSKILPSSVENYYILSTEPILEKDREKIEDDVQQIQNVHGCQLIINGVIPTIKYLLRPLHDTTNFIENYAALLADDKAIKFEHKAAWNKLISEM